MTQEEKQLLLKDLCARLPYGIKVEIYLTDNELEKMIGKEHPNPTELHPFNLNLPNEESPFIIKPYLRPMSSMTEEEREIYDSMFIEIDGSRCALFPTALIDWLNEHHFDYRGLIEKGLALEAPEDMYNKEESEKGGEIPIPKNVDEAVKTLAKIVSKEDKDYLLKNGAISMHNSMGRWIRNEWGLWTGSELKNELKKKGFEHPDDMSNYIIEEFIKYWNNKT